MGFRYQCGDKPLDGYTIKRGIGSGGFGDVYLAVSDGGKDVALKCIRSTMNREIERRGVSQCINLKHPSLLTLYDLRTDDRLETWVVMELLLGQSLALLINKSSSQSNPYSPFFINNFVTSILTNSPIKLYELKLEIFKLNLYFLSLQLHKFIGHFGNQS